MAGLIVHEWFAKHGGSENVVEQMLEAVPESDLQVLWNDRDPEDRPARETWLARSPLRNHKALSLPFHLPTWRRLTSDQEYDWILASSHLFAHHARLRDQPDIPKYVYAHTPARYIWVPELDARGASVPVRAAAAILKPLDRKRAQESVRIAANSRFTRERVKASWGREADVIYPPVDVDRILDVPDWSLELNDDELRVLESLPEDYLLGASRMIPYKRLDLVLQAGEATRMPVVLAGAGPLWDQLAALAETSTVPVRMIRRPSDAMLFALYQRARALIFPAVEDFGIMPVEAMAAGLPVIVPAAGGAAESVSTLEGGTVIDEFSPASWLRAVSSLDDVDRRKLPARTRRFSNRAFRTAIREWLPTSEVSDSHPDRSHV